VVKSLYTLSLWWSAFWAGWATYHPPVETIQPPPVRQPSENWRELDWEKWIFQEQMFDATDRSYQLPDGSEVDLLSKDYSYEIDYAAKWKEAIGQALFYSIMTGKSPGIILLMGKGDYRTERMYYLRCKLVCSKYEIRLQLVKMKDYL
jgi:hypothetical protein